MLPVVQTKIFTHHLTGLNKDIQYRAFTGKEQKILLQAKDVKDIKYPDNFDDLSEESKRKIELKIKKSMQEKVDSVRQLAHNCTFGKIDVNSLAFFDLLDLFIRIRIVSVSEICELRYSLLDPETNKTEFYTVSVDLNDVVVKLSSDHTKQIKLSETSGFMMKYPTFDIIAKQYDEKEFFISCIDYAYDGEKIEDLSKYSIQEIEEWYDTFDISILMEIQKFFLTMPNISHEIEIKVKERNEETGEIEDKVIIKKLKGLEDFFQF